jgi:hypothetical protein
MAKTPNPKTDATGVNHAAESPAPGEAINAANVATPENTPIPGGGRWGWDHLHACWVETIEPVADPLPTLE